MKSFFLFILYLLFAWANPAVNMPDQAPAKLADSLFLPADLRSSVWAESPMFYNPTNMDIDHRGRIWVTEAVNYRDFNNDPKKNLSHPKGDRVMILEDTNGDGKADTSKVFVEDTDLRSPLGIAVIGNQVIVSCSPSVIIYTDTNADDKPDKKELFLTGFGGYDHDHGLHSLVAGPDGDWYFNTGNAGPHKVTDKAGWHLRSGSLYTGGTPYNTSNEPAQKSDDGRIWVGGMALRINPDGTGLKVLAHNFRNSYETALDSYGNMWQNDNDDQVVTCRTSFLMEGGNAGYFSRDGSRYWQADQRPGQSAFTAHWHQDDPGVMPAGDNTGAGSPTGIVVYEGDDLGEAYRGMLLSADAGRNVIFGYHPEPKGAGFELKRMNFISSVNTSTEDYKWDTKETDEKKWFRPSDVAVGPDGAIYIADWYDPIVGGHAMKDPKGFGRIYRITPANKKLSVPKPDLKSTAGQIRALKSPAVNVRNLGFVALKTKGGAVLGEVKKLLNEKNPYHRARAVWLMAQLGLKGVAETEKLLNSPDEAIRLTAFRALKTVKKDLLPVAAKLVADPSAAVRREVAISLRDVPVERSGDLLLKLAQQYRSDDPWYLTALTIGMEGKEGLLYARLKKTYGADPLKWSPQVAGLVSGLHPSAAAADLAKRAASASLDTAQHKKAITALGFINTQQAAGLMFAIAGNSSLPAEAEQAKWWLSFRSKNDWAAFDTKTEDTEASTANANAALLELMQSVANVTLPEKKRTEAALKLADDTDGARMLLSLAAQGKLTTAMKKELSAAMFSVSDQSLKTLALDYFTRPGERKLFNVDAISLLKGDKVKGKLVFLANCATCHKAEGAGNTIGPDLSDINNKFDRKTLLDAMLNPNSAVVFGYEPWLITTKSGETVYGFQQSAGKILTIKDAYGREHAVKADDVAFRKKTGTLMPNPELLNLNEQQLADIASYLEQLGKK